VSVDSESTNPDTPLRVATLNCWALPYGLARHTEARLAALGERLPDLPADVLSLQEVWTAEARETLLAAGRRGGLEPAFGSAGGPDHGGLVVLSRLPVLRARFAPFTLAGVALHVHRGDYQGGKGFAAVEVETAAGVAQIVATHLHARYGLDDPYRSHRVGQVVELARDMAEAPLPVVAAGDFNLREGNEGYSILRQSSGLRDVAVELDARRPTVRASSPYRGGGHRGDERIDYVFVRDGETTGVTPRRIRRVLDEPLEIEGESGTYSDHAGLLAEFVLRPGRGSPPPFPDRRALERARAILVAGRGEARARLGRHGALAGTSLLVAGGATAAARRQHRIRRRRLLRLGTLGLAGLAAPWPAVFGASALHWVPGEIAAFDRALDDLDAWTARTADPDPPGGPRVEPTAHGGGRGAQRRDARGYFGSLNA